jgi:acetolactate synthase I/III small subunit
MTTSSSTRPKKPTGRSCDEEEKQDLTYERNEGMTENIEIYRTVEAPEHHILSVLVENKAGVLARVSGLFARRGYNIFSLAVAPSENDRYSRITIVADAESAPLEQITKQLFKLIDVVKITHLNPGESVSRELLLVTVSASAETRGQITELVTIFEGKIVAVGTDALTISLDGSPTKLDDFEELLRGYGIVELQRTGRVALPKLVRERNRPTPTRGEAR